MWMLAAQVLNAKLVSLLSGAAAAEATLTATQVCIHLKGGSRLVPPGRPAMEVAAHSAGVLQQWGADHPAT